MTIDIEVVLAGPRAQQVLALAVPVGCTAREAVRRALSAGLDTGIAPDLDVTGGPLGLFGERIDDDRVLDAGDRVELYRPLRQDPREWRRRRAAAGATATAGAAAGAAAGAGATGATAGTLSRDAARR